MSRVSMDEILHHARSGSEPVISNWDLLDRGKGGYFSPRFPLLCMFVSPRLLKWTLSSHSPSWPRGKIGDSATHSAALAQKIPCC